jgi:hypothetical protein
VSTNTNTNTNTNVPAEKSRVQTPRAARPARSARSERPDEGKPTPDEVMAEAAAIYPDTSSAPPTPDEIAAEAYAIYLSRGGQHGRHDEDWYEAERRLKERQRQERPPEEPREGRPGK